MLLMVRVEVMKNQRWMCRDVVRKVRQVLFNALTGFVVAIL